MAEPQAPAEKPNRAEPVLEVRELSIGFDSEEGHLPIVRELSFSIARGESLALVGESGCGKSITALAIMGLIDPPGRVTGGSVRLRGEELTAKSDAELQGVRGRRIGMVFQEPMTSLNPVLTVGDQIGEVLRRHLGLDRGAERARVLELLDRVGLPAAERRIDQYPHELSGGMKQRIMIAMALACEVDLLIADEPTTALDVTIQAQILRLLERLRQESGMSLLLITHNLGVVAHHADRIIVMYAGEMAEEAGVRQLFRKAQHPYTQALLASLPDARHAGQPLASIRGTVPQPRDFPAGCRFATRCGEVLERCASERPTVTGLDSGHRVACWQRVQPA